MQENVFYQKNFWTKMPDGIIFRPWVGSRFNEGTPGSGRKLLILGEAHYEKNGELQNPPASFTIDQVDGAWRRDSSGRGALFYQRITELLCGVQKSDWTDLNAGDRIEAWQRVAFGNLVQGFVGREANTVPKKEQWENGVTALKELLEAIKPDRVLVLGVRNWNNIEYGEAVPSCVLSDGQGAEHKVYDFPIPNGAAGTNRSALASYVWHPSRFVTFQQRWVLQQLLAIKR